MVFQIFLIALLVAVLFGLALNQFVEVIDQRASARISKAEQPAQKKTTQAEEKVGGWLERLVPAYVRQIDRKSVV